MTTELQYTYTLETYPEIIAELGAILEDRMDRSLVSFVRLCPGAGTAYRFNLYAALDPAHAYVVLEGDTGRRVIYALNHPAPHLFQTGVDMTDALLADVVNAAQGRVTTYYVEYCKTHRGGH